MTEPPVPSAAHRALDVLAGRWVTRGTIHATADVPAAELLAIDRCEWLPGGFFLLHHVDARLGGVTAQSLEVIGHAPARLLRQPVLRRPRGQRGVHGAPRRPGVGDRRRGGALPRRVHGRR
jgi:hypothetical protein